MNEFSQYYPYIAVLVVASVFLIFFRQCLAAYISIKNKELLLLAKSHQNDIAYPAYERISIFLDRIKPANLIKNYDSNLAVHEFIYLTEKAVNEEFSYNVGQQIYINEAIWEDIVRAKSKVLFHLKSTYEKMSNTSSLEEFKRVFLMSYMNDGDAVLHCLNLIRKEIK